ncbi:hypothetical protein B0H10DRAFT_2214140 [Mycena sp. CBHHK59/15]|nr:hypothetical protein B0H10DRAFT_2214140 [Mycena sp. CBHHK59/15]
MSPKAKGGSKLPPPPLPFKLWESRDAHLGNIAKNRPKAPAGQAQQVKAQKAAKKQADEDKRLASFEKAAAIDLHTEAQAEQRDLTANHPPSEIVKKVLRPCPVNPATEDEATGEDAVIDPASSGPGPGSSDEYVPPADGDNNQEDDEELDPSADEANPKPLPAGRKPKPSKGSARAAVKNSADAQRAALASSTTGSSKRKADPTSKQVLHYFLPADKTDAAKVRQVLCPPKKSRAGALGGLHED